MTKTRQRTKEQLSQIDVSIEHLTEEIKVLTESLEQNARKLDDYRLELFYRNKINRDFGYLMRRLKVIDLSTIDEVLEAALDPREFRDVILLNLLATGQLREPPGGPEIWLAIEISSVVDSNDVDRA